MSQDQFWETLISQLKFGFILSFIGFVLGLLYGKVFSFMSGFFLLGIGIKSIMSQQTVFLLGLPGVARSLQAVVTGIVLILTGVVILLIL